MDVRDLPTAAALNILADPHTRIFFSQFGEDIIVWSLLQTLGLLGQPGFYVDVGACHPKRGSNTEMLRLLGWRGMNIDANPDNIALFAKERPDDINVVAAVSDVEEEIVFTTYEASALSTADPLLKERHDGLSKVTRIECMTTRTLANVLHENLDPSQTVDMMSVDVEGFDLRVLKSNDWDRFAPRLLLVEDHAMSLTVAPSTECHKFLTSKGYRLASLAFVTAIYLRDLV